MLERAGLLVMVTVGVGTDTTGVTFGVTDVVTVREVEDCVLGVDRKGTLLLVLRAV